MNHNHKNISKLQELMEVCDFIKASKPLLGYDLETTGVCWWNKNEAIVGFGFGYIKDGTCHTYYVPVGHDYGFDENLPLINVAAVLDPILRSNEIHKVGANIRFDVHFSRAQGLEVNNTHDVQVMARLVRSDLKKVGLKFLCEREFGQPHQSKKDLVTWARKQKPRIKITEQEVEPGAFAKCPVELVGKYCGEDVYWTLRLAVMYGKELKADPKLDALYRSIERKLMVAVVEMEKHGIRVDSTYLEGRKRELSKIVAIGEAKIYELAGRAFNIESNAEIRDIVLPLGVQPEDRRRKKKDGVVETSSSIDAKVLEKYKHIPFVKALLVYKKATKLLNTYVIPMLEKAAQGDGIIHASIRQETARTGRLSATDPNLMNLPKPKEVEDPIMQRNSIRRAIIPHVYPGESPTCLLCCDLKQIEYRLLAHFAGDESLLKVFHDGLDFHAFVAAQIFDKKIEELTKDERSTGKKFNFAQLYGSSAAHLAAQCKISMPQVQKLLRLYVKLFPGIADFKRRTEWQCQKNGGVRNPFGRFRKLTSRQSYIAVNTLIQGTAADMFKIAMVRVHGLLLPKISKLLFPVHDELVISWVMSDGDIVEGVVKAMTEFKNSEGGPIFRVPIEADVEIASYNWEQRKKYDLIHDLDAVMAAHEKKYQENVRKMRRDEAFEEARFLGKV